MLHNTALYKFPILFYFILNTVHWTMLQLTATTKLQRHCHCHYHNHCY